MLDQRRVRGDLQFVAHVFATAALVLLSAGCGPEGSERRAPPRLWHVADEPVLAIDGVDAESFFRISQVMFGPDASIIVMNTGTSEILRFRRDGAPLERLGRFGDGPGEFRNIAGALYLEPDTLIVFDASLWRLTTLRLDGELLQSLPLPAIDGKLPSNRYRLAGRIGGGRFALVPDVMAPVAKGQGVVVMTAAVMAFDPTDSSLEPFGPLASEEVLSNGTVSTTRPLGIRTVFAFHGDRMYVGDPGESVIRAISAFGVDSFRIAVPLPRVPVSRHIADSIVNSVSDATVSRAAFRKWKALLVWPDSTPAFARALFDTSGQLWVQAHSLDETGPRTWHVFAPTGDWVAQIETPKGFVIHQAGDGLLLGTYADALAAEGVRVYLYNDHKVERPR